MQVKDIYHPILSDLNQLDKELNLTGDKLNSSDMKEIIRYFFSIPGKRLRPALAFLSAGIIENDLPRSKKEQLIQYAVGLELIHSASLIHDDVIDGDLFRRGQSTLNNIYGKKIAVLAGDVVFSIAFSKLSNSLPKEFDNIIVELTEYMCAAEVLQAEDHTPSREIYFKIIEGKTALFMSVSCKVAAAIAGATKEQMACLEEYGLNLGLAYQIMDDCIDKDINDQLNITVEDAKIFGTKAIASLESFEDSEYKRSLINLVHYIMSRS